METSTTAFYNRVDTLSDAEKEFYADYSGAVINYQLEEERRLKEEGESQEALESSVSSSSALSTHAQSTTDQESEIPDFITDPVNNPPAIPFYRNPNYVEENIKYVEWYRTLDEARNITHYDSDEFYTERNGVVSRKHGSDNFEILVYDREVEDES